MTAIQRLAPGDEGRLDAYLARHPATSLFLRSNLRRVGLTDKGQRFQARYVALVDGAGAVQGVVAHAWNGNLLIQAEPVAAVELARYHIAVGDRPVKGILGPLAAMRAVQALFSGRPTLKDGAEDLFDLPLADLHVPPALADGALLWRRAGEAHLDLLSGWRRDYCLETLGEADSDDLRARARADVTAWVLAGDVFLLTDAAGTPLSMATHNARIPDIVQIGGVWTPVAARGRGYARAAVAGALLAAREDGAATGVLFTGKQNAPARRAYLSLGFRIIGDYGIVLLG
ncbi:GNAT family N-acetyltransferase [Niveispirillum sp. KHB5.9]|uniref:GNAT family N-acetyltransferase n=1 Tax=Niveispirillum sp. KHB5.9 TaxID=3400269 RepID=UPI003A8AD5AF